jgi:hypothetical protein
MNRRIIGYALTACAVAAVAGCGGTARGAPSEPTPGGTGSADAGSLALPSATTSAAPPSPARCADGQPIAVEPTRPPGPICLKVGDTLHLSSAPSPHQPWEPFASSDPAVVSCDTVRAPDGAVRADCTAHKPGHAVVSTGTMPFRGDPHGPAQQMWQVTITVTP